MDPNRDDPVEEDEEPSVAGGIGAVYVGRPEKRGADNDEGSHVSPSDNDGETVPGDEAGRGATSGGR